MRCNAHTAILFSIPETKCNVPIHSMKNAVCQIYQDVVLHLVAFRSMQASMLFFGYPSPTILCSAAEVKSPFRMSSIHPSINLFIHPSPGGHGGGPPAEGQPEPKLLRPAQHLPADPRGQRAEPTGAAARGDPPVPHPILTRHPLDPAVCGLPGPRRT